jgi:hypothetical protein
MLYLNLLITIIPLLAIIPLIAAFFLPFYTKVFSTGNVQVRKINSYVKQEISITNKQYIYLDKIKIEIIENLRNYDIANNKTLSTNSNIMETQTFKLDDLDSDNNTVKLIKTILALLIILIIGCIIQLLLNSLSNKLFHDLVSLLILLLSVLIISLVSYAGPSIDYKIDTGAILCFVFLSIIFLKEAFTNKIIKNVIKNIK